MKNISIICDTNIWYSVDSLIRTDPQSKLLGTLINLLELSRTPWNLDQSEIARVACKQFMQRHKGICVYSPLKSIAIVSGIGVDDGNEKQVCDCVDFIAAIADGDEIDAAKKWKFRELIEFERKRLVELADQLNTLVDSARSAGVNKRDKMRGQDMTETKQFITSLASLSIRSEIKPEQINWDEAELLLRTMHSLFLDFEVSGRRWQPNDINDLFNLAYVGKDDMYWTLEKRWINIIKGANMGRYLFSPDSID